MEPWEPLVYLFQDILCVKDGMHNQLWRIGLDHLTRFALTKHMNCKKIEMISHRYLIPKSSNIAFFEYQNRNDMLIRTQISSSFKCRYGREVWRSRIHDTASKHTYSTTLAFVHIVGQLGNDSTNALLHQVTSGVGFTRQAGTWPRT